MRFHVPMWERQPNRKYFQGSPTRNIDLISYRDKIIIIKILTFIDKKKMVQL